MTKSNSVLDALIKMTKDDIYQHGERFPSERELAEQLGVGRNVIREALASMESIGLIEKKPRQGVFIKRSDTFEAMKNLNYLQMPPATFMPMQMELRMIIAVPAVEMAAHRRTESDLQKLWECYRQFESTPIATPEEELANSKWEALLHHLEVEAAHNDLLTRINESIADLIEKNNSFVHHHVLSRDENWLDHIKSQHKTIITAIENRDSKLAGQTLKDHLVESYESMKKNYNEYLREGFEIYWEMMGS